MDFMNLNQSAHGDREFGFMQTRMGLRRKTVVGHWSDPAVARRIGAWARAACGWHELQRLEVARFGDNMRQVAVTEGDKVEAQLRLGVSVNGYGVGDLVRARARGRRRGRGRAGAGVRGPSTTSSRRCARAASGARRCATRRGSRRGSARSSTRAASRPSPTRSRISRDLPQLPGIARPAADGGRLRVRRRGRLEDRGARARREGDGRRRSTAAAPSWRTTRTTSRRATDACSVRTCSRCARRSRTGGRRARSTRSRSAAAAIRCGSSSPRAPALRSTSRSSTSATASGCS